MRLKPKLVLAISSLVLLISGIVSLVYVTQLLNAAVKQTYETNRMVADQVRFALQEALESGLKDRTVDPNNPAELRNLEAQAIHDSARAPRGDRFGQPLLPHRLRHQHRRRQLRTLASTNPDNVDKPLPVRSDYKQLLNADAFQLYRDVFGPPQGLDVVVPLDRNGEPFATVHVGARTTLLREIYTPWLAEALTLTCFALGAALIAALLLSNLALRPLEKSACSSTTGPQPDEAAEESDARLQPGHARARLHQN